MVIWSLIIDFLHACFMFQEPKKSMKSRNFGLIVVGTVAIQVLNVHAKLYANWSSRFWDTTDTVLKNAISRQTHSKRQFWFLFNETKIIDTLKILTNTPLNLYCKILYSFFAKKFSQIVWKTTCHTAILP